MLPNPAFKILVADDEANIRKLIREALEKEGYHVELYATGREAVERMKQEKFDAVITDLVMPDMDGIDVLSNAHQYLPNAARFMITAYPTEAVDRHAFYLDLHLIVKPFTLEELCETVNNVLKNVQK